MLILYSHPLEASDMNFQTIWIPKGIMAKFLSEKSWSKHSYLKYALVKLTVESES